MSAAAETAERIISGPTVLLGSGAYYNVETPESSSMSIEDVAWGLACTGRFSGQCVNQSKRKRCYYSVAEHCVRMSLAIPQEHAMAALMHELGEVLYRDMASPVKATMPEYRAHEKRSEMVLQEQFGVRAAAPEIIKHFDLVMLATEKRDLMPAQADLWSNLRGIAPLTRRIYSTWPPDVAAKSFIDRYVHLLKRRST